MIFRFSLLRLHQGSEEILFTKKKQTLTTNTQYFINVASFKDITSYASGGAISCVNQDSVNLHVLDSTFYKCVSLDGGAIYLTSSFDSIFFSTRNCIAECSAYSQCSGYDIQTQKNGIKQNYINFTTFSKCKSSGTDTLVMDYGTVTMDGTNFSLNEATSRVCPNLMGTTQIFCNFNTFIDNKCNDILFTASRSHFFMSYSNFIANTINENSTLISFSNLDSVVLNNVIFLTDVACKLFDLDSNLLQIGVNVSDIYIHPNFNTSAIVFNGEPKITEQINSYKLKFVSAKYCHADDGVYRSFAMEIAGIVFACLFLLLLIITIVVYCCARSTTMQEVNLGPLEIE